MWNNILTQVGASQFLNGIEGQVSTAISTNPSALVPVIGTVVGSFVTIIGVLRNKVGGLIDTMNTNSEKSTNQIADVLRLKDEMEEKLSAEKDQFKSMYESDHASLIKQGESFTKQIAVNNADKQKIIDLQEVNKQLTIERDALTNTLESTTVIHNK